MVTFTMSLVTAHQGLLKTRVLRLETQHPEEERLALCLRKPALAWLPAGTGDHYSHPRAPHLSSPSFAAQ